MPADPRLRPKVLLIAALLLASCTPAGERQVEWSTGTFPSIDGVPISYQAAGEGPVSVVFVHGWTCDRSYWREQLDHFAGLSGVRHYSIDLCVRCSGYHDAAHLGRKEIGYY